MCLILFAHQACQDYPLLVAANRDEFHARPTAAATFWEDQPQVFAGRDLQAGGTWLGVDRSGRFAAITNFRDPANTGPAARSRGELTANYLSGSQSAEEYLRAIATIANQYAGFNLLLGEGEALWYFTNSAAGAQPQRLQPGIYGLSNARLDTPWPKVVAGKQRLRRELATTPSHQGLARAVSSRELASNAQLQDQALDGEMERLLSAQFIVSPHYGTRATTTLIKDASGTIRCREVSFSPAGDATGETSTSMP